MILLQNAFPTLEKYIDHPHIRNGAPMKVSTNLISEILSNFTWMMIMKKKGLNLFFTDIDSIKEKMLKFLAMIMIQKTEHV